VENVPTVTKAFFNSRAFCLPKLFGKNKLHFKSMIKVRSECVRRQSDTKEVNAKPFLEYFFVNIVFQRLDSERIYNELMSHQKVLQTHQKDWWRKTS